MLTQPSCLGQPFGAMTCRQSSAKGSTMPSSCIVAAKFAKSFSPVDRETEMNPPKQLRRNHMRWRTAFLSTTFCSSKSRTQLTKTSSTQKQLADKNNLKKVLLVSDPMHMRRAITMAGDVGLDASPSPTPTTRYRTWRSQLSELTRETFYYWGTCRRVISNSDLDVY